MTGPTETWLGFAGVLVLGWVIGVVISDRLSLPISSSLAPRVARFCWAGALLAGAAAAIPLATPGDFIRIGLGATLGAITRAMAATAIARRTTGEDGQ